MRLAKLEHAKSYRVIEAKGSYKIGAIVDGFTAFYFDLRVEAV